MLKLNRRRSSLRNFVIASITIIIYLTISRSRVLEIFLPRTTGESPVVSPHFALLVATDGKQAVGNTVQTFVGDSVENKRKYAKRHNYTLFENDLSGWTRPSELISPIWSKIWAINKTLVELVDDGDWLWYIDTDIMIMQEQYSLPDHVFGSEFFCDSQPTLEKGPQARFSEAATCTEQQREQLGVLIARDCNGFNAGSLMLRNKPEIHKLLETWLSPLFQHIRMEHDEQDVLEILYYLRPDYAKLFGFVDQRVFNAFPPTSCHGRGGEAGVYIPGDFVVHMAGCGSDSNWFALLFLHKWETNKSSQALWDRFSSSNITLHIEPLFVDRGAPPAAPVATTADETPNDSSSSEHKEQTATNEEVVTSDFS